MIRKALSINNTPLQAKQLIKSTTSVFLHSLKDAIWQKQLQLWATGGWQLHHDDVPTHATCLVQRILAKNQITQVNQCPYSPDLAPQDFWLFPKLKSPLKGKRLQIINEIQENVERQMMETGRMVWSPKVPTLKGT